MSQRAGAQRTSRRPFRVSAFLLIGVCAAVLGYAPPAAAQFGGVPTFVVPPANIPINTNPVTVAVGDLNGDTYPDLVIPVNAAGGIAILLNNGAGGGFTVQPIITTGTLAETAVLADLNGDGKLDIVVANIGDPNALPTPILGTVSILLGNGDGTFANAPGSPLTAPWTTPATAASPWSVAVGKIDAGANLDIAVVNKGTDNVSVFLGNGNGTFGAATTVPVSAIAGADPRGVAIVDLNGDGLGDIVTTNYRQGAASTDNVSVLIRQAGGGFAAPVSYTTGNAPRSLAVGLLNADALPDVVVANSDASTVTVLLGNGTGGFAASPVSYPADPGGAAFGVSIGDLNGDGKADVAVTNMNFSTVSLFRGDGLGGLSAATDITSGAAPSASPAFAGIGDFNKDGQNDLAVTNFNLGSASIFINNTIPMANLSVTKVQTTPAAPPLVAGAQVVFTITVNNAGPDPAAAVQVTDTPTGLVFVSNTGDCTTAFPCNLGTVAGSGAGATKVITSTFLVPSGTLGGATVSNSATVSSTTVDPVAGNNTSATGPIAVVRSTDLSITKVKTSPATLVAGQNVVYTITVNSAGPSDAAAVQVTDTPGAGLSFVSNAGACTTAFPCDLGTFVAGSAAKVITSTYLVQSGAGATVTNSASVSSTGGGASPDPNTGNNTSSTGAIAVTRSADLGINKAGPTAGVAGQDIVYTITITNAGPSDAAGVQVADPATAGLVFVSNTGACGTAFPCNLGTVAANGPAQVITSTWNVPIAFGGASVTNTATVSSTTTDPTPANNTSAVTTTIGAPSADLSITKTGPTKALRGQNIVYTVTVTNNGPTSAASVTVADSTPAGLTFVSNTGACTTAYNCNLGTLAAGAARTITSTYAVPAAYAGPEPIVNTATVSSPTADPTPGNNSATAATPVDPQDFHTVAPCRVVDTRDAATGGPSLVAGASRAFAVSGVCGVPATAKALSVNVTVVGPSGPGDLRLYPAGTTPPLASTINYSAGQVRANNAVIRVSATGIEVLVDQAAGTVDFILDVNGYFEP